jgi:hypothetical protein
MGIAASCAGVIHVEAVPAWALVVLIVLLLILKEIDMFRFEKEGALVGVWEKSLLWVIWRKVFILQGEMDVPSLKKKN